MQVSVVGFGTWGIGGETEFGGKQIGLGPADPDEAIAALQFAAENGVNFFDSADIYGKGQAESLISKALYGKFLNTAVICTKFGNRETADGSSGKDFSAKWLHESVNGSLRRLRRDWIDVLLLHSPPDDFNWAQLDRTPFDKLVNAGKIRAYGVSCRSYRGAERVLEAGFGHVLEVIYNVMDRRIEDVVLPTAQRQGVGVIARLPLASGFLTEQCLTSSPSFTATDIRAALPQKEVRWRLDMVRRLQFLSESPYGVSGASLRFCLSHPGIATVIPGMRRAGHVQHNIGAAQFGPLEHDIIAKIKTMIPEVFPEWKQA